MLVKLKIIEAAELKVVQLIGKQDPYVKVKYDKNTYKTEVINDGDRACSI